MAEAITILGICGSLRKGSYNRGMLRAAQQLCPEGVKLEIFELDGIPAFNQDEEQHPPAKVLELKKRVRAAEAILLATPEYNYSIPGALKNAIDWASRPYGDNAWDGKPVALMSAALSKGGGVRAQYHLRQSFVFLNMDAVVQPEVAVGDAPASFDEQGTLTNAASKKLIAQLVQSLARKARHARPAMKAVA